jgi:hypothetical protein
MKTAFPSFAAGGGHSVFSLNRPAGTWGFVLGYGDLLKWDNIKELILIEYIFKQLDMYNFLFTSDVVNVKSD